MLSELLQFKSDTPEISSAILGKIGEFAVSNTLLSGVVLTLFFVLVALIINYKYRPATQVPGSMQAFFEIAYEGIFGFLHGMTRSYSATTKLIGIICTLFFFIFFSNIFTTIPPFSFLTYESNGQTISMFRAHTSDFNTTFGIAGALIIITHMIMIANKGILGYLNAYLPIIGVIQDSIKEPKKTLSNLASYPINQFIGILDLIGEAAKSLSISLRLFGNIFAGEVLTVIFFGLLAPGIPALWWLMGLFTAAIQTVVFAALLTSSFTGAMKIEPDVK